MVRLRGSAQSSVLLSGVRFSFLSPPLVGQRQEARFMELSGGEVGKGGKEAPRGVPGLKQEMLLIETYLLHPVLPSAAKSVTLGSASPGLNDSLPSKGHQLLQAFMTLPSKGNWEEQRGMEGTVLQFHSCKWSF